jgi:uncharacterized protein
MSLQDQIRNDLTTAMKMRKALDLAVLRATMSAFTNELVAKRRKPGDKLTDEEALAVIKRLAKQRVESADQYQKGNRVDLAEQELKERNILLQYLPAVMTPDEIQVVAMRKKQEMGINDRSNMGILMAEIMKELRGKADGADVKEVVNKLFL